jgi:ribosomal protein L30E
MLSKSQVHHFDGNNIELGKWTSLERHRTLQLTI